MRSGNCLTLFLSVLLLVSGAKAAEPPLSGDVNADGAFNALDLNLALKAFLSGDSSLLRPWVADVAPDPSASPRGHGDGLFLSDDLNRLFRAFLGIQPLPAEPSVTVLASASPLSGETGVAVTRETILRFSRPLAPASVTDENVHADYAGHRIPSHLHLSPDGMTLTLFYPNDLPAAVRIRVTIDGDHLPDQTGLPVDGDQDGFAGGIGAVDFDTLALAPLPDTTVCGRVFASELKPDGNTPLKGVAITVDGAEEMMFAVTDVNGDFCLDPAPAGEFFVHIDGGSAQNAVPPGGYYPKVGKKWTSVAGKEAKIGNIYLPLIAAGTLQPVNRSQETDIHMAPSVLAAHPEFADVKVMVPPDSLYSDSGTRGGMVGISPVPPDRIPGPLPPGLEFPVVITVQSNGPQNFDVPAPVCFPNLPDPATGLTPAAGDKNWLYSYDHDAGEWKATGPMTVSADGKTVCTDPGVGIKAPGWEGSGPPPDSPDPPDPPEPDDPDDPNSCPTGDDSALAVGGPKLLQSGPNCKKPCKDKDFKTCAQGKVDERNREAAELRAWQEQAFKNCFLKDPKTGKKTLQPFLARAFYREVAKRAMEIIRRYTDGLKECQSSCLPATPDKPDLGPPPNDDQPPCSEDGASQCITDTFNRRLADLADLGKVYSEKLKACVVYDPIKQTRITDAACVAALDRSGADRAIQIWENSREREDSCTKCLGPLLRPRPRPLQASPLQATPPPTPYPWDDGDPIGVRQQQILDLLAYTARTGRASSQAVLDQIDALQAEIENLAGGDATAYLEQKAREAEQQVQQSAGSLNPGDGNAPPYPVLYAATVRRPGGTIVIRGETKPGGRYSLFVPRDGVVDDVRFYDPRTKRYGSILPNVLPDGIRKLPRFTLLPLDKNEYDFDNDGLADVIETIYGTDPDKADTDGDGINDGAEVDQGLNPLGAGTAITGIIATADLPGDAKDVAALNDLAAVADGDAGVSVFNIFNAMNPVAIAQVDTPGDAQAVAFSGSFLAVADGVTGLAIVDLSDPPAARVVRQVDVGGIAKAVTAAGDVAYVGVANVGVIAVDLATGTIIDRVFLFTVQDVAVAGDVLYVLGGGIVTAFPLDVGKLQASGSASGSSGGTSRLFVGGGIAYATYQNGYQTFSLADPKQPKSIAQGDSLQLNWRQIVANGSGLGVAAVGVSTQSDATQDVQLYDLKDPAHTNQFLTLIPTPEKAAAVSIYNGLAYVADARSAPDHSSGLRVINYLPYDDKGVPPTIHLSVTGGTGQVAEGSRVTVAANVADDVQVRNVEFYVDDVHVATDGTFPFENSLVVPALSQKASLRVRARASDTGGNATWSDELVLTVVKDTSAPVVTVANPAPGSIVPPPPAITVTFSKPIRESDVTATTLKLYVPGSDGQLGTADDAPVDTTLTYHSDANTLFLVPDRALRKGAYRAVLNPPLSDIAGNPVAGQYAWNFQVSSPQVIAHDPATIASNQPATAISVTFDRPMDSATLTPADFRLFNTGPDGFLNSADDELVTGGTLSLQSDNHKVILTFAQSLPGGQYRVAVGPPLADTGGNVVESETDWTFPVDFPRVIGVFPSNGSTTDPVTYVETIFSEAMNPATLTDGSIRIYEAGPDRLIGTDDDVPVSGGVLSFQPGNTSALLTFEHPLRNGFYRVVVGPPVANANGRSPASFSWTFHTAPLKVTGVTPRPGTASGATTAVSATFNAPLDPATVTSSSFRVFSIGPDGSANTFDDAAVSGGTASVKDATATLKLAAALPVGVYYAVLSPTVADTTGNPLHATYTWIFRVPAVPDADGDGIPDALEPSLGLDPTKKDTDSNGRDDGDEDFDNDGFTNRYEILAGTDPAKADTDGNGTTDVSEDSDHDGVSNYDEMNKGLDPGRADTDYDGVVDKDEITAGTNPSDPLSWPKMTVPSHIVSYGNGIPGPATGGSTTAVEPPELTGHTVNGVFSSDSTGADGDLVFYSPPPPSDYHEMAYDSARKVIVLYTPGAGSTQHTWEWDGTRWTYKPTAHLPPARVLTTMAYDSARKVIVLQGGYDYTNPNSTPLSDTWEYDGSDWVQKTSASAPQLNRPVAAYDAARQRTLVTGTNINFGMETWEWDGVNWSKDAPAHQPAGLAEGLSMAYDSARHVVALFTGYNFRQLWEWDGTDWHQRTSQTIPDVSFTQMTYDSARGEILLFDGTKTPTVTWAWNGVDWKLKDTPVAPASRTSASLAFDEERKQVVLFGGTAYGPGTSGSGNANETWIWNGSVWSAPPRTQPDVVLDMAEKPDGVWNYNTIEIPERVRVRFKPNRANTPVVWLVKGDVTIDGEVNLDGADTVVPPAPGSETPGGPGGYAGGQGGVAKNTSGSYAGLPGMGPGGGLPGLVIAPYPNTQPGNGGPAGYAQPGMPPYGGIDYGNFLDQPLLGGSGGGGGASGDTQDGPSGSGGGGAILIAASGTLRMGTVGKISTNPGRATSYGTYAGQGSGGAIRVVANRVEMPGSGIRLYGDGIGNGTQTRVRVETFEYLTGQVYNAFSPPLALRLPRTGSVRITKVGGQKPPALPDGKAWSPDVAFGLSGTVEVEMATRNVPPGTRLTVRATVRGENITALSSPVAADASGNGVAMATLTLPAGVGTLQAYADYGGLP